MAVRLRWSAEWILSTGDIREGPQRKEKLSYHGKSSDLQGMEHMNVSSNAWQKQDITCISTVSCEKPRKSNRIENEARRPTEARKVQKN